ncbi:MAG: hypothetical protein ABI026_02160 [Gemmatimonadaceae bacterium]
MQNGHSLEDILDFLNHAGSRGLMPAATAQALSVATRNVFAVLDDAEKTNLPLDDLDGVIRRFNNKRAREFSPKSLKEYDRRVQRAVEMYGQWKNDPANFTVKTRATNPARKRDQANGRVMESTVPDRVEADAEATGIRTPFPATAGRGDGYSTAFPVRMGQVVTVSNIPLDLTTGEAERLAQFIRMLAQA